jgi:crotonobetainyl-CoA:carnitine CoA-transferase CaiB-like acyl-CoA transferase
MSQSLLDGVVVHVGGGAPAAIAARWLTDLGARVGDAEHADVQLLAGPVATLDAGARRAGTRRIVAAITPFGLDGPRAHWRSTEIVAQALGGMLWLNGHADEPPLRALGAQADECAGLQAALGVGLALLARARGLADGQLIDVSIHESVVASLEHVIGRYRHDGTIAARQGSLHWSGAFRAGDCADGPVLLSHLGDWTALREWLLADGAAADLAAPRWEDEAERRAHAAHVFDVLDAWARRYRRDQLLARAALLRLPFAPILPIDPAADSRWCGVRRTAGGPRRDPAQVAAPRLLLDGVRVLDFTWVVAGPLATRVLADFGAEVVKVERPDTPDDDARRGGLFGQLNRGKQSVVLDLRRGADRELARRLAAAADVVVDNFSPRVMANWGLDGAAIHAGNPNAIVAALSAFGAGDARVGYGPTVQALAGFTWHMRHPGGTPAGLGFAYADVATGYAAALAIVAALWRRERSGGGAMLDLSQLGVARRLLPDGPLLDAAGNSAPGELAAPHGVYRCAQVRRSGRAEGCERWLAVSVSSDDEWQRLCEVLGVAWSADARFAAAPARRVNRAALDAMLAVELGARHAAALAEALQAAGVAAGVCADAADLCDADPQLAARGYFVRVDGAWLEAPLPRLGTTPGRLRRAGPRRDEQRAEVLRSLAAMDDKQPASAGRGA